MFNCKPINWPSVVTIVNGKLSTQEHTVFIKESYLQGKRMRLDIQGLEMATKSSFIPIDHVAIAQQHR